MTRFAPLTLAALLLSACAGAFEPATGRPDAVDVRTPDAPDDAYRAAARVLLDAGYTLAQSDPTLRAASTEFVSRRGLEVSLSFAVSEAAPAVVTFRGRYRVPALGDTPEPIVRRGMSGSPAMRAWEELRAAAEAYPGGQVTERAP